MHQTPIFGEHGEPAAKDKIWAKSAVLADYGVDCDIAGVLALVRALESGVVSNVCFYSPKTSDLPHHS